MRSGAGERADGRPGCSWGREFEDERLGPCVGVGHPHVEVGHVLLDPREERPLREPVDPLQALLPLPRRQTGGRGAVSLVRLEDLGLATLVLHGLVLLLGDGLVQGGVDAVEDVADRDTGGVLYDDGPREVSGDELDALEDGLCGEGVVVGC